MRDGKVRVARRLGHCTNCWQAEYKPKASLRNFQVSLSPAKDGNAPANAKSAEVLSFNSGGTGARAGLDGLNATAFPSGDDHAGGSYRKCWAADYPAQRIASG